MKIVILYYILLNIAAFLFMGWDKSMAKAAARRIPERVLLGLAALGGAFGLWCGIYCFHHKTRHLKFTVTTPLLILVHLGFWLVYFLR